MQRIVLIRHGETVGESSIRFHGRGDVALSAHGAAQLQATAHGLRRRFGSEPGRLVAASPLQRSWHGARIVSGHHPTRIFEGFREVDFGRWEGLTAEEIEARDPALYAEWQAGGTDFTYPEGDSRSAFRARVRSGLEELLAAPGGTCVAVLHKGVIREIVRLLIGEDVLERDRPALAEAHVLSRGDRYALIDTFGPE